MIKHAGLIAIFLHFSIANAISGNYNWQPIEIYKSEFPSGSVEISLELGSDSDLRSTSVADYNIRAFEDYDLRITPLFNIPADKIAFDDWSPNNYSKRSGITLRNLYIQNTKFGLGIMQLSQSDTLVGLILDPNDQYAWDATDPVLIQPLGIPAAYYRYEFTPGISLTGRYSFAPWSKISSQELPDGDKKSAAHGGTAKNYELISEITSIENQRIALYASRTNSPWPIDRNNEPGEHESVSNEFEADVYNKYNLGMDWQFKSNECNAGLKAGAYYAEEDVDSKILMVPFLEKLFPIFGDQARIGIGYFYSHSFNKGNAFLQNHFDPRLWLNNSGILSFEIPIKICTIKSEFIYDLANGNIIVESAITIPISTKISLDAKTEFIKGFEDLHDTNPVAGSIGLNFKF